MTANGAAGANGSSSAPREILTAIAEQRHAAAVAQVAAARDRHPGETAHELSARLIRSCARDLAMAGAVSGGAAASPAAGPASAAALLGAEGAMNAARLGELVMAIGILHGHDDASSGDRAVWLAAALGAAEGTALGVTGMAARAGVRGSARVMRRIPSVPASSRLGRLGALASTGKGPWGLAALLPYTLGASVGAVGNTALALSVGRAANRYFATLGASRAGKAGNRAGDARRTSRNDDSWHDDALHDDSWHDDEIWDVEVVSERVIQDP